MIDIIRVMLKAVDNNEIFSSCVFFCRISPWSIWFNGDSQLPKIERVDKGIIVFDRIFLFDIIFDAEGIPQLSTIIITFFVDKFIN